MSDTKTISKYDELAAVLVAEHITRWVGREAGRDWAKVRDLRTMLGITAGKSGQAGDVVMRDKRKAAADNLAKIEAEALAAMMAGNMTRVSELTASLNAANSELAECRKVERKAGTLRQLQLDCEDAKNATQPAYCAPRMADKSDELLAAIVANGGITLPEGVTNEYLAAAVGNYALLTSLQADTLDALETLAADAKAAIAHADALKAGVGEIEAKITAREKALAGYADGDTSPESADLRKAIKALGKNLEAAKSEHVNAAQLAETAIKAAQEAAAEKYGNN